MQRSLFVSLVLAGALVSPVTSRSADRPDNAAANEPLVTKVYPVADLVVSPQTVALAPVPVGAALADPSFDKEFAALEQHLRRLTGANAWKEDEAVKPFAKRISLVIRQTPAVHEQIANELNRLRRELDVQAVLAFHVIAGSRQEIAALADAFPGELGQFETEQLLKRAQESKTLKRTMSPRVTVLSRQTAQVTFDGRTIAAHATVSDDRRSIRLKVSEGPEKGTDLLGNVEIVRIHSGRSVALRFEDSRIGGNIPPAPDATERLLVVTANVLIAEEEEALNKVVFVVSPRIIVQPEEELLGIPTDDVGR